MCTGGLESVKALVVPKWVASLVACNMTLWRNGGLDCICLELLEQMIQMEFGSSLRWVILWDH